MLARAALTVLYLWYKQEGRQLVMSKNSSAKGFVGRSPNSSADDSVNDISTEVFWTLYYFLIFDTLQQITAVASKVPVSVQTFLDIGYFRSIYLCYFNLFLRFSIRRFSNSFLFRQQRHYENKFRDFVIKQRAEKNARQMDERIFTEGQIREKERYP